MEHALQVKILKELIHQLDSKTNVDAGKLVRIPAADYVNEDLAKTEWEQLFLSQPQVIGLSGDLPEKNTFFTSDELGIPILATRDRDGKFAAFINSCKHRGSKLAQERRGSKRNFVCPFHAWNYSNQGDLIAIANEDNFGDVDKSCLSLTPLPCEEHGGLLWVHPQVDGELDVEKFLGPLAEEIASHNFGELVYCDEKAITKDLNWKLANDTFGETYHFSKLHKNTLGQIFHGDALAYEEFGKHHRFVFARKSINELRVLPEEEWELARGATTIYYLFPNIQLTINQVSGVLIRIYPDSEKTGRSHTIVGHYYKQEALDMIEKAKEADLNMKVVGAENVYERRGLEDAVFQVEAGIEIFNSTVENEDYAMGELSQKAAETGAIEHFIFGRNEKPLHHYHNTFRKALGRQELEVL